MRKSDASYYFLGDGEEVQDVLTVEPIRYIVTNWRFIVYTNLSDRKTQTFDEFDYKYIAHVYSNSVESQKNRGLGVLAIISGIALFALGYIFDGSFLGFELKYGLYILCGFLIVLGLYLILKPIVVKTTLSIELSGISKTFTYEILASAEEVQRLLKSVAKMREMIKMYFRMRRVQSTPS